MEVKTKNNALPAWLTVATLALAVLFSYAIPFGPNEFVPGARATTGGTIYPHIKTWGFFVATEGTVPETTFAASKLDMLGGRLGTNGKELVFSINPDALVCGYFNVPASNTASGSFTDWIAATGYDPEDFVLHYTEDNYVLFYDRTQKGWRSECSPAGCTPPATATSESGARMPGNTDETWAWWNHDDPRLAHYVGWQLNSFGTFGPTPAQCLFLDTVPVFAATLSAMSFPKSDVYAGIATDDSHPRIAKHFTWGNEVIDHIASQYGVSMFGIPNMTASSVNITEPFKTLGEQEYDWALLENWVAYVPSDSSISGVSPGNYESDYPNDIVAILTQTHAGEKRLIRAFEVYGSESNRGKIFGLANFYLVNNENTYFNYRRHGIPDNLDVPTNHWFTAIEYSIGQPKLNPAGQADYLGSLNTTEHYEWASGTDPASPTKTYHIMARHYDNALVLVKYKPTGSTFGDTSATTHALPQPYYPLQSDGTLGAEISQVTLKNNEAAILIPKDVTPPAAINNLQAL